MFIEVDTSSKPERALLAQVVLLALNDACQAPYKSDEGLRMGRDAFTAMRFLFDKNTSGLNEYATWLGFDPGHFRLKLLNIMADSSPKIIGEWDAMKRRTFRMNHKLWQNLQDMALDIPEEEEDDETV